ncbi:protein FATTY ACID EXPORT 3, chloroplastic isoform X2 [Diospyros lotus]|uniref:protein FATTY ACID EXPORT 3, chloroplastic isoform X2 n=1 Tax=Diospyros lotus TaxID=55363 RepID=UPI00225B98E1|nr:protein FATTY ACID EXPORT 3, chloroplastic isoform X2 [Diospyros lotus]
MSITVDPFALPNPSPNPSSTALLSRRASTALFSSPASLRFEPLLLRPPSRASMAARPLYPRGLGLFPLLHRRGSGDRLVFAFSASHEESSSDIEVEEVKNDLKLGAEESQEAWKQALASFKEQALKMKSVSQEAYELYSKKAMVILKENSEQLKIQAEKARYDLSVIAKEISEESKEYLSTAAESSPEPVKDIIETFASSTDDVKEISEVRDFYLGIPYGILLSFGGFLSFMLTGSVSAIRFGVILGGTLLALSISSLRSWKKGESFHLALKGQAAITSILFVREISLLYRRPSFVNCFTSLISGAVVVFYLYRITLEGGQANASSLEHGTEN